STSGTAVLTMPIMAPLADTVNIGRESVINAYQFGNGIFNLVNPTSLVLAFLGVAEIGYDRFLKFVWPLIAALIVVCMIFLTISIY
ncbi:MAG: YfcC family protein, partial [Cyclobacteriaceae bacterium]